MRSYEVFLPLPPSVDNQYQNVQHPTDLQKVALTMTGEYEGRKRRHGRRLAPEARRWKNAAILLVQSKASRTRFRIEAPYVGLDVTFYFKTLLKRDRDNGLKILQDAVCDGLGIRDNRVVTGRTSKEVAQDGTLGAAVRVWEIWEWPSQSNGRDT